MSEIEKQFFDTFGIKPFYKAKKYEGWGITAERIFANKEDAEKFGDVFGDKPQYPEITDSILLKLICIYIGYERIYMGTFEIDHFRRFILSMLMNLYKEMIFIKHKERLKHQVQALFKENN